MLLLLLLLFYCCVTNPFKRFKSHQSALTPKQQSISPRNTVPVGLNRAPVQFPPVSPPVIEPQKHHKFNILMESMDFTSCLYWIPHVPFCPCRLANLSPIWGILTERTCRKLKLVRLTQLYLLIKTGSAVSGVSWWQGTSQVWCGIRSPWSCRTCSPPGLVSPSPDPQCRSRWFSGRYCSLSWCSAGWCCPAHHHFLAASPSCQWWRPHQRHERLVRWARHHPACHRWRVSYLRIVVCS